MSDTSMNIAKRAEKVAAGGIRFLFAPQMKLGIAPTKGILAGFVQMIAQFLAVAKLVPTTHRALRPLSPADARLGEVLALAWVNVRKPGVKLDQMAVFGAVTALMTLTTLVLINMIGTMIVGSANAAFNFSITFGNACAGPGNASFFTAPCATDMAQSWIDMLFLNQQPGWIQQLVAFLGGQGVQGTTIMSGAMASGLTAMFETYSYAMLIVAGFLVLYHVLAIVAGTAHDGHFGGKSMNQVWAPIRLVMAIGLLVPLGINGLNSGQMIVIQVAKWGSALASNVWANFATNFAASTGNFIIMPPLPQVSPTLKDALKILVCTAGYNELGTNGGGFTVEPTDWYSVSYNGNPGATIRKSWDWHNGGGGAVANDVETTTCGAVEMPNPDYTSQGSAFEFLGTSAIMTASEALRQSLLEAHKEALDTLMEVQPTTAPTCDANGQAQGEDDGGGDNLLYRLAARIYWSANAGNTCYVLKAADLELFDEAVSAYRGTANGTGILGALITAFGANGAGFETDQMAADAQARGWMSAGVWFNTIARVNGQLMDYMQEMPVAKPAFKALVPQQLANTIVTGMESVDASIASLPNLMAINGNNLAEPGFTVAFGGSGGGSTLDLYLKTLAGNFAFVLGKGAGDNNYNDVASTTGSASAFQLNTANPLAELAALGHRIIDLAMKASNSVQKCMSDTITEQGLVGKGGAWEGYSGDTFKQGCGVSAAGVVPTEAFIMQAAVGAMISGGITLAFMLPLMPFIRFMFGILTWVLSMFETVIAIPVVALAHIKMDGEGLSGPMARTAYLLVLQLFVRPTLMIFGLVLALLVFNLMIMALNEFYTMAVRGVENGGRQGAIGAVVYTVIYASLAYALANASFKAIDLVPNQVLQWIGGPNSQGIDESARVSGAVSQVAGIGHQALGSKMHSPMQQSAMQKGIPPAVQGYT